MSSDAALYFAARVLGLSAEWQRTRTRASPKKMRSQRRAPVKTRLTSIEKTAAKARFLLVRWTTKSDETFIDDALIRYMMLQAHIERITPNRALGLVTTAKTISPQTIWQ